MSSQYPSFTTDRELATRAFVRDDGKANIICPACSRAKLVFVKKYLNRKRIIKARCPCWCIFKVEFDYRRAFKKSTNFTGKCCSDVNEG